MAWSALARTCSALALLSCAGTACATRAQYVIEADLEPARVYAGAEARLTLRLLRAPGVPFGALRPPKAAGGAEFSPLGPMRTYELARAGVRWQVSERSYVVVPVQPGTLVVPGAELEEPLDHAAGTVRGPPRVLEVRPPPPGGGEPWLPARRVTLEESWSADPAALVAGTPVTRTLLLRAEGLPAERLPPLAMAPQPGLQVHHDLPEKANEMTGAGVASRLRQRIALIPLAEGRIDLPALGVHWWDVAANAPREAALAARALQVGPSLAAEAPPAPPEPLSPRAVLHGFAAVIVVLAVTVLAWYLRGLPRREARRELRAACRRRDPAIARDALLGWWKVAAPGAPARPLHAIGEGWDEAARAQLAALDAALYGARAWDGRAFWRGVRRSLRGPAARRTGRARTLPPLFRIQETADLVDAGRRDQPEARRRHHHR